MQAVAHVAKAITGAVSAASAAAVSAGLDGTITNGEWLTILVSAIGAGYAVWQTPWLPGAPPAAE
jgi:hypothetical protein